VTWVGPKMDFSSKSVILKKKIYKRFAHETQKITLYAFANLN